MTQGTPEWHEKRRGLATASAFKDALAKIKSGEAAARRNYRTQLVVERLTGVVAPSYENDAMRHGKESEPFARIAYEAKTGRMVQEVDFIKHETLAAGCSPDGLINDDGGVEIKCPYQSAVHIETLLNGMPPEHIPQIQGSMWITGRKWWDFVSYDPRLPEDLQLYIERVNRDEKYIENLHSEVKTFLGEVDSMLAQLVALRHKQAA